MSSQRQIDVWAQALVEASIVGDVVTAEKYKVTERTLRNWRRWVKTDPELHRLYEEKMSRVDAEFADSLTTRSALVVVRGQGSPDPRGRGEHKQMARELADAAAAEIVAVAARCGLPEVKSAERGHALPAGRRISLFIVHRDATVSVCEVLPAEAHEHARSLGHLLFCYEQTRQHYRLPASSVRLCVLSDGDAPPLWNRVVANLKVEIRFYNIADVVRARLAQNVLASEVTPAAGSPSS